MISSDINWPDQLPNAQRSGHESRVAQTFSRTELVSGRARQRRKFTSVPVAAQFSWIFTDYQAQVFEAWYRDVINDGAAWFNIKRKTPMGMQSVVCRFASMYEGPMLFGVNRWRYSATLEIWSRPIWPLGWGHFPEYLSDRTDLIDLGLNDEWPEP